MGAGPLLRPAEQHPIAEVMVTPSSIEALTVPPSMTMGPLVWSLPPPMAAAMFRPPPRATASTVPLTKVIEPEASCADPPTTAPLPADSARRLPSENDWKTTEAPCGTRTVAAVAEHPMASEDPRSLTRTDADGERSSRGRSPSKRTPSRVTSHAPSPATLMEWAVAGPSA